MQYEDNRKSLNLYLKLNSSLALLAILSAWLVLMMQRESDKNSTAELATSELLPTDFTSSSTQLLTTLLALAIALQQRATLSVPAFSAAAAFALPSQVLAATTPPSMLPEMGSDNNFDISDQHRFKINTALGDIIKFMAFSLQPPLSNYFLGVFYHNITEEATRDRFFDITAIVFDRLGQEQSSLQMHTNLKVNYVLSFGQYFAQEISARWAIQPMSGNRFSSYGFVFEDDEQYLGKINLYAAVFKVSEVEILGSTGNRTELRVEMVFDKHKVNDGPIGKYDYYDGYNYNYESYSDTDSKLYQANEFLHYYDEEGSSPSSHMHRSSVYAGSRGFYDLFVYAWVDKGFMNDTVALKARVVENNLRELKLHPVQTLYEVKENILITRQIMPMLELPEAGHFLTSHINCVLQRCKVERVAHRIIYQDEDEDILIRQVPLVINPNFPCSFDLDGLSDEEYLLFRSDYNSIYSLETVFDGHQLQYHKSASNTTNTGILFRLVNPIYNEHFDKWYDYCRQGYYDPSYDDPSDRSFKPVDRVVGYAYQDYEDDDDDYDYDDNYLGRWALIESKFFDHDESEFHIMYYRKGAYLVGNPSSDTVIFHHENRELIKPMYDVSFVTVQEQGPPSHPLYAVFIWSSDQPDYSKPVSPSKFQFRVVPFDPTLTLVNKRIQFTAGDKLNLGIQVLSAMNPHRFSISLVLNPPDLGLIALDDGVEEQLSYIEIKEYNPSRGTWSASGVYSRVLHVIDYLVLATNPNRKHRSSSSTIEISLKDDLVSDDLHRSVSQRGTITLSELSLLLTKAILNFSEKRIVNDLPLSQEQMSVQRLPSRDVVFFPVCRNSAFLLDNSVASSFQEDDLNTSNVTFSIFDRRQEASCTIALSYSDSTSRTESFPVTIIPNRLPTLVKQFFDLGQGLTIDVTRTNLEIFDNDNGNTTSIGIYPNCQGGYFRDKISSQRLSVLTDEQICSHPTNCQLEFVRRDAHTVPSCSIQLSDDGGITKTDPVRLSFVVDDIPQLAVTSAVFDLAFARATKNLTITTNQIKIDKLPDKNVTYYPDCTNSAFSLGGNVVSAFSERDLASRQLVYTIIDRRKVPSCVIALAYVDGGSRTDGFPITIISNRLPTLVNQLFDFGFRKEIDITSNTIEVVDKDSDEAAIRVISNCQGGYFKNKTTNTYLSYFTVDQVCSEALVGCDLGFIRSDTQTLPSCTIQLSDDNGITKTDPVSLSFAVDIIPQLIQPTIDLTHCTTREKGCSADIDCNTFELVQEESVCEYVGNLTFQARTQYAWFEVNGKQTVIFSADNLREKETVVKFVWQTDITDREPTCHLQLSVNGGPYSKPQDVIISHKYHQTDLQKIEEQIQRFIVASQATSATLNTATFILSVVASFFTAYACYQQYSSSKNEMKRHRDNVALARANNFFTFWNSSDPERDGVDKLRTERRLEATFANLGRDVDVDLRTEINETASSQARLLIHQGLLRQRSASATSHQKESGKKTRPKIKKKKETTSPKNQSQQTPTQHQKQGSASSASAAASQGASTGGGSSAPGPCGGVTTTTPAP